MPKAGGWKSPAFKAYLDVDGATDREAASAHVEEAGEEQEWPPGAEEVGLLPAAHRDPLLLKVSEERSRAARTKANRRATEDEFDEELADGAWGHGARDGDKRGETIGLAAVILVAAKGGSGICSGGGCFDALTTRCP